MKTIELISGSQKAQFTTKSVTFNGKEFFYANMSDVADHADDCFYTFTYDGELHTLPYEKKDAKILNAIFSQVQNMKSAKKQEPAEQPEPAPEKPAEEQPAGDVQEQPQETAEEQKDAGCVGRKIHFNGILLIVEGYLLSRNFFLHRISKAAETLLITV